MLQYVWISIFFGVMLCSSIMSILGDMKARKRSKSEFIAMCKPLIRERKYSKVLRLLRQHARLMLCYSEDILTELSEYARSLEARTDKE